MHPYTHASRLELSSHRIASYIPRPSSICHSNPLSSSNFPLHHLILYPLFTNSVTISHLTHRINLEPPALHRTLHLIHPTLPTQTLITPVRQVLHQPFNLVSGHRSICMLYKCAHLNAETRRTHDLIVIVVEAVVGDRFRVWKPVFGQEPSRADALFVAPEGTRVRAFKRLRAGFESVDSATGGGWVEG